MLSETQSTLQLKQKHAMHKYPDIYIYKSMPMVYKQLEININNQNIQNKKHFHATSTHIKVFKKCYLLGQNTLLSKILQNILLSK